MDSHDTAHLDPHTTPRLDPQAAAQALRDQLQPWHEAVANPAQAQETVLRRRHRGDVRSAAGRPARPGCPTTICSSSRSKHGRAFKMLREMKPGEMGGLVVSTPILARYRIGDTILALSPPYYRCIGRENWWTGLNYHWNELVSLNLGRL